MMCESDNADPLCGTPRDLPTSRLVKVYSSENKPEFVDIGEDISLCLNYKADVYAVVLLMSNDFSKSWWLSEDCSFAKHFSIFMSGENTKSCRHILPPVNKGWLAWMVFGKPLYQVNFEQDPYELGIMQFELGLSSCLDACIESCVSSGGDYMSCSFQCQVQCEAQ